MMINFYNLTISTLDVDSVVTAEGQVIKVALVSDLSALSKSNGQLLPGTSSSQARSRKRTAAARSMQPRGPVVTGLPPGVRLPTHPLRPPFTARNPAKQVKIRFSQNLQTRDKAIQVDVEQCKLSIFHPPLINRQNKTKCIVEYGSVKSSKKKVF